MNLKRPQKNIEIFENRKEHLADFIRLNEQLISSCFVLEDVEGYALSAMP